MRKNKTLMFAINEAKRISGNTRGAHTGAFVGALVVIILGLALLSPVTDYVAAAVNASPSNAGILNIIPTLWVVGVMVSAAGLAYMGAKK